MESVTPTQRPGCLPEGYDENSILTPEQMGIWTHQKARTVIRKARRRFYPAMRDGRSYRFHVGTIIQVTVKPAKK